DVVLHCRVERDGDLIAAKEEEEASLSLRLQLTGEILVPLPGGVGDGLFDQAVVEIVERTRGLLLEGDDAVLGRYGGWGDGGGSSFGDLGLLLCVFPGQVVS